jgi:uncharacterized membrane protein YkvA (DUF1232 family)
MVESARLLPDLIRLCARMGRDRSTPRRARLALLLALVYNVQPINVIPNFIPVVGLADNVVVTFMALRYAMRRTSADLARSHWPGTPAGYRTVCRLLAVRQGGPLERSLTPAKTASPDPGGQP